MVEATKLSEGIETATQPVIVIQREEIAATAQTDLTEILRMQPGFEFKQAGGPGQFSYPRLRGFSDSILYIIDGVKINDGRSGGVGNLVGQIDPTALERIEILRGPQATLFGADTTAGVVSLTTASGGELGGTLRGEAGSLDWKKGSAALRGEAALGSGVLGFSATGAVIDSGGVHQYEYYDNTTLTGRLVYEAPFGEIGASVFYTDNSFNFAELDEAYCCQTTETQWAFQTPDPNQTNATQALVASAWIGHNITDNLRHKLLVGHYSRDADTFSADDGLLGYQQAPFDNFVFDGVTYGAGDAVPIYDGSGVENYSTSTNFQVTYDLVFSHEVFEVLVGSEYWEQKYESSGTYGLSDDKQDVYSFYGQVRLPLMNDRLNFEAGIRHDEYNAWGGYTTYSAGASFVLSDAITLYGNYGTSFTQPTLSQLFNTSYGDSSLTPATGETFEGGIRARLLDDRLVGSVTLYSSDVENVIVYDYSIPNPRTTSGFGQYANRDGKRSKGVEADLSVMLTDELSIRGVYSYSDAEQSDGAGGYERVVQNARHSGNVGLRYDSDRFDLGATLYLTGERLRWAADVFMPAYTRLDISARYYVLPERLAVYTRIENLLDEKIVEGAGYEQPGVYAIAGVQLDF